MPAGPATPRRQSKPRDKPREGQRRAGGPEPSAHRHCRTRIAARRAHTAARPPRAETQRRNAAAQARLHIGMPVHQVVVQLLAAARSNMAANRVRLCVCSHGGGHHHKTQATGHPPRNAAASHVRRPQDAPVNGNKRLEVIAKVVRRAMWGVE